MAAHRAALCHPDMQFRGACTQTSDATFMTPLTCLSELSKLYYGTLECHRQPLKRE